MRRLTLLAALVLAVVLIAAVPVVASEARANLEASLTGEKEVPGPGDPKDAHGRLLRGLRGDKRAAKQEAKGAPLPLLRQRPQRPLPRWSDKGPAALGRLGFQATLDTRGRKGRDLAPGPSLLALIHPTS